METKIGKLEREMNDERTSSSLLSSTMNDLTLEIGKLQAEANVMLWSLYFLLDGFYHLQWIVDIVVRV